MYPNPNQFKNIQEQINQIPSTQKIKKQSVFKSKQMKNLSNPSNSIQNIHIQIECKQTQINPIKSNQKSTNHPNPNESK
jgi:hypothetical protein